MFTHTTQLGSLTVSRFIVGGNPFSGFSHQGSARDLEMKRYFTVARIKAVLREAEALGLRTLISRADFHIMRLLLEYWDEGGSLDWIAQTCPQVGEIERGVLNASSGGAKACYIHGGVMDYLFAQQELDKLPAAIALIRDAGMAAGIAAHNPRVVQWANDHLDVDFYMCCYYNPTSRADNPEHVAGTKEWFHDDDRDRMTAVIAPLTRPAIHYKILAAGRTTPADAYAYVGQHLRPQDAVCVGIYPKDQPDQLAENVRLFEGMLEAQAVVR
jgi:hypothetical protein